MVVLVDFLLGDTSRMHGKERMPVSSTKSVLCLYHDDADGRCSAAIVLRALGKHVVLHAMDYQAPAPWHLIGAAGVVVIVDFSLSTEDMQRICETSELIWIDHHKTAIEDLAALADLPGLRDLDEAGCVLTWRYFFPQEPMPEAVAYIGDRDVWRFAIPETAHFSEGLFYEDSNPGNHDLWAPLLDREPGLVRGLIERGQVLNKARLAGIRRRVERYGFEIVFEGHRTLAINLRGNGDIGAYIRELGYTLAYCYFDSFRNGRLMTTVTLYSDEVDVSVIAQRFGGGGHGGAAGFSFERIDSPFPRDAQVQVIARPPASLSS